MFCKDCYWCSENTCCNTESENYNKVFTDEQIKTFECPDAESEQAVDYQNMNAWDFALKYYM